MTTLLRQAVGNMSTAKATTSSNTVDGRGCRHGGDISNSSKNNSTRDNDWRHHSSSSFISIRSQKSDRASSFSSSNRSNNSIAKRPHRITMAGMIYDANQSLERAMDPKTSGLHPGLFDDDLLGIGFYTIWEAGLIFSGNVGTGIVFARNPTNGTWSAPAAVGLSGIGWGLMGGASRKTIVYLIYDYFTLQSMSGEHGAMLRAQAESSLFAWGRTAEASAIVTAKGVGTNIALSYGRGIFGGISIEGALCKGRNRVNERFYGCKVSTADILFSGRPMNVPDGTLLPEVYDKLKRLCDGLSVYTPSPEERIRVETTRPLVNEEGEEAMKEEIIEFVKMSDDLQRSSSGIFLEETDSNEIEVSENMDVFAELVDKEDESRHRPHIAIPPPISWPVSFSSEEDDSKRLFGRSRSSGSKKHNTAKQNVQKQRSRSDVDKMTADAQVDMQSKQKAEKKR